MTDDFLAYAIYGRGSMLRLPDFEDFDLLAADSSGTLRWFRGDFHAVSGFTSPEVPRKDLGWRVIAWREQGGIRHPEHAEDCSSLACLHGNPLERCVVVQNRLDWRGERS
ncbi:hypothetical protein [Coralloluteibacterium stylophorae]|uniref:Uncharacterized protein n=1 Tax=Coralloluteibacterium stylophorae TaxID=1776034 RepID=A0A8J8AWL1_9GAMM|nr:hypothetical protein [Coralloluteibacterium stylophorae]MBS7457708.1 hypothetical protein [Coralloluteibacterium stylophorae]